MSKFLMYSEVVEDPKVQKLSSGVFKAWVNVLCLSSRHEGILPSDEDISFKLRFSLEQVHKLKAILHEANLLDFDGTTWSIHAWEKRQKKRKKKMTIEAMTFKQFFEGKDPEIPKAWGDIAYGMGLRVEDINWEWGKFRDYWVNATKNSRKSDWLGTWRNWIRKRVEEKKRKEHLDDLYTRR